MSVVAARTGPDRLVALTTTVLLVMSGAALVAGLLAATVPAPVALGDPGPLTTTGLPLARYLQDVLGALVVGCTLLPVLHADGDLARRARALLAPTAAAWAVVTALVYVLTASDLAGRGVPRVLTLSVQQQFLSVPQAQAQALVLVCAVVLLVASRARVGRNPWVRRGLLVVATAGLLPPAFAGHSAAAADHGTAVASLAVHLVAASMWVGGLAVLAVLVLSDRRVGAGTALPLVRSYSSLALPCVVAVGASGVLNAALRVDPADVLTSPYGRLLLAKAGAVLALAAVGWWHRRRSITELAGASSHGGGPWSELARATFVRLVVVELAVMALTVAAAVVLARTPPPGPTG